MDDSDNQYKKRTTPYWAFFLIGGAIVIAISSDTQGAGVTNYIAYWINNTTLNYTNLSVSGIATWYFDAEPYNNTTNTVALYVSPATVFTDGYMTAVQATSLAGKAVADVCVGYNSTHINVTMNYTTAGSQCVAVQYNQSFVDTNSGGNVSSTNGTANYSARWNSNTQISQGSFYDNGSRVGIGNTAPNYTLDITGGIRAQLFNLTPTTTYIWQMNDASSSGALWITNGGLFAENGVYRIVSSGGDITFHTGGTRNSLTEGTEWFRIQNTTGRIGANISVPTSSFDIRGNLSVQWGLKAAQFYGRGAPTVAAGDGAGTTPTVVNQGNDAYGLVNLTSGTLPIAGGNVFNLTYGNAYITQPYCVLDPANNNAAALSGVTMVRIEYASSSATKFVVTAGGTGLTGATDYKWVYHCGG